LLSCGDKLTEDAWLADAAAATHMTMSSENMFDTEGVSEGVTTGDRKALRSAKMGKAKAKVVQKGGTEKELTLAEVKVAPSLHCNLFSLTKAMPQGRKFHSTDDDPVAAKKGSFEMAFDRCTKTPRGMAPEHSCVQRGHSLALEALLKWRTDHKR
jgi:hypothetical protein